MQPFPPPVQIGEISEQELEYDGSDSKKPLLVEIKGQIFDVSQSRSLGDGDGRKRFSRATDILVKILQSCGLFELIFIVTIVCQA
ncbi:hypothetical protein P3L10_009723 [Capsicum annuum]